jgi:DUF438 domain-containing protein
LSEKIISDFCWSKIQTEMCDVAKKNNIFFPRMNLRGCRSVGIIVDMLEDNIKMELEEIAYARFCKMK